MIRPSIVISWGKSAKTLGSFYLQMKSDGLRIKEVILEDTGMYVCKAINGFGHDEITFRLGIKSE